MLREIPSGAQEKTEEAVRDCRTKIRSKKRKEGRQEVKEKKKGVRLDDNHLNAYFNNKKGYYFHL